MSAQIYQTIFNIFDQAKTKNYIGESISQLDHALQCAHFAQKSHAHRDEILSALLHDIGHLCAPKHCQTMGSWGVSDHEKIGADYLEIFGFKKSVTDPIRFHVQAKRYLVATNKKYADRLSLASKNTLAYQGGPMSQAECKEFCQKKYFKQILRLRSWDEMGKVPNLKVANFSAYRDLIFQHLNEQELCQATS